MPDTTPDPEEAAWRMQAIASELTPAGLHTRVHKTRDCAYLTAVIPADGHRREIEAVVDEDLYIELRFWAAPEATPAQVSAIITGAIAEITAAPSA